MKYNTTLVIVGLIFAISLAVVIFPQTSQAASSDNKDLATKKPLSRIVDLIGEAKGKVQTWRDKLKASPNQRREKIVNFMKWIGEDPKRLGFVVIVLAGNVHFWTCLNSLSGAFHKFMERILPYFSFSTFLFGFFLLRLLFVLVDRYSWAKFVVVPLVFLFLTKCIMSFIGLELFFEENLTEQDQEVNPLPSDPPIKEEDDAAPIMSLPVKSIDLLVPEKGHGNKTLSNPTLFYARLLDNMMPCVEDLEGSDDLPYDDSPSSPDDLVEIKPTFWDILLARYGRKRGDHSPDDVNSFDQKLRFLPPSSILTAIACYAEYLLTGKLDKSAEGQIVKTDGNAHVIYEIPWKTWGLLIALHISYLSNIVSFRLLKKKNYFIDPVGRKSFYVANCIITFASYTFSIFLIFRLVKRGFKFFHAHVQTDKFNLILCGCALLIIIYALLFYATIFVCAMLKSFVLLRLLAKNRSKPIPIPGY